MHIYYCDEYMRDENLSHSDLRSRADYLALSEDRKSSARFEVALGVFLTICFYLIVGPSTPVQVGVSSAAG